MNIKLNIAKYFSLASLVLMLFSCEESNNVIDEVVEGTERGAILRTVNVISDEIAIGTTDGYFGVELEVQDMENGGLVNAVDVYASFKDGTPDNGKGGDTAESLVESVPSSSFTIGEFGLPRFTYNVTLPSLIAATGIPESDVDGSDQFRIRFELVMSDGRTYSFAQNSGTLTGSFFSSPFLYTATIVCPPKAPTPGDWIVNMTDSYGDGWQTDTGLGGSGITVTLDNGTIIEVGMCSPYGGAAGTFLGDGTCTPNDGYSGSATVTIPAGTQSAEWYFPGDNYGEIGFEIVTPNGNVVGGYTGVEAGPITIDFCKD